MKRPLAFVFIAILSVSTLAISTRAKAAATSGDSAKFFGYVDEVVDGDSVHAPIITELRLIDFDRGRDEFLQRTTTAYDGEAHISDEWIAANAVLAAEDGALIVETCRDQGGNSEVARVPAGDFESCKITQDTQDAIVTTWYAAVPFAMAKQMIASKNKAKSILLELESFERSQPIFAAPSH